MIVNEKSELLSSMDQNGENKTCLQTSKNGKRCNFVKQFGLAIYNFFALFCEELLLNGSERVDRELLEEEDFMLEKEDLVADYDIKGLQQHWKDSIMKKTFRSRIIFAIRNISRRTFPTICLYLMNFYFLTSLMIVYICPSTTVQNSNQTVVRHQIKTLNDTVMEENDLCKGFVRMHALWVKNEVILNGILTFLVGFYVSFIVRNWWQNVKIFPGIDTLCITISSFISVDPKIKEKNAEIIVNRKIVSVKKFKKDVARLFLLSWAMCFCRVSCRLRRRFENPKAFQSIKLLSSKEYEKLKTKNGDGWLERWATPLLWANKMIGSVRKNKINGTCNLHEDLVKINDTTRTEVALLSFKDSLEEVTKQYYFQIPGLMHQVINIALYFFLGLGVFAGQDIMHYYKEDSMHLIGKLLFNFPLYYCAKYVLLIGWIKIAKDLQNPFGDDR